MRMDTEAESCHERQSLVMRGRVLSFKSEGIGRQRGTPGRVCHSATLCHTLCQCHPLHHTTHSARESEVFTHSARESEVSSVEQTRHSQPQIARM